MLLDTIPHSSVETSGFVTFSDFSDYHVNLLTLHGVDRQVRLPPLTHGLSDELSGAVRVVKTLRCTFTVVQLHVNLRSDKHNTGIAHKDYFSM